MIKLKEMNMIISKDLRIGNIVSQGVIIEIRQYTSRVRYQVDGKERTSLIRYDDLEPIILTEEWLLKNSFKRTYSLNYEGVIMALPVIVRFFSGVAYSEVGGIYLGDRIKHVHEYQNLYYAICGKELEVKCM